MKRIIYKKLILTFMISVFFGCFVLSMFVSRAFSEGRTVKGEVYDVISSQYVVVIRYLTNQRHNIFAQINYYIDDGTKVVKNNKEVKFSRLSKGDLVIVKERPDALGQRIPDEITVVDSWSKK